ncbi:hypothetical protein EVD26_14335 [Brucella abortus]|nr:hypothetical protein EVD26_14335 [Brucella abortus]
MQRIPVSSQPDCAPSLCFVALSNVSKRDQKSVQWTDFPRVDASHFWLENAHFCRLHYPTQNRYALLLEMLYTDQRSMSPL